MTSFATSALLLMDYQIGICLSGGSALAPEAARRGVLAHARECLDSARLAGMTVIHVRVAFDAHYTLRINRSQRFAGLELRRALLLSSDEAQFCAEVQPLASEPIITKGCVNPFIGTPLRELLTARRINELFLGGVATNFVVESAARHAADSGFAVTVIEDLCASLDLSMHEFAMSKIIPAFAEIMCADDFVSRFSLAI